jgi:hypothetical protein
VPNPNLFLIAVCDAAAVVAAAHAANAAAVVAAAAGRLDLALASRRQCMALATLQCVMPPLAMAAFLDNDAALLTRLGRAGEALAAATTSLHIRRRAFEDHEAGHSAGAEAAVEAVEAVEAVPSLRAMARALEAQGHAELAQRTFAAAVALLDKSPLGGSSQGAARVRGALSPAHGNREESKPC